MFFNICTRQWIIKNAIPTDELINAIKKKNHKVIKNVFSYRFSPKDLRSNFFAVFWKAGGVCP